MWDTIAPVLTLVAAVGVIAINLAGVLLVVLQLPGTWLIVLITGLWAWWHWDDQAVGLWTLAGLLLLAVLGEVVETFAGVVTAGRVRSSKRGMVLALVGGIVGAIAGTGLIPVPVVGTLIGACVGAAAGAMLGDRWAGRDWRQVTRAGSAAARGRLWGTLGKLAIAIAMWLLATTAMLW